MKLSDHVAGILGAVLLPFVAGAFVVAQARGDKQVDAIGPASARSGPVSTRSAGGRRASAPARLDPSRA